MMLFAAIRSFCGITMSVEVNLLFMFFYGALLLIFQCAGVSSQGCSFPLTSTGKHMPVLTSNSEVKFIIPQEGKILMQTNEVINLACTGPNNKLVDTNTPTSPITCVHGETIKISNQNKRFEKTVCTKSPKGTVTNTTDKCGPGRRGNFMNIGFPLAAGKFITLIRICYDFDKGNTFYSWHEVIGSQLEYIPKSKFKRSTTFSGEGLNHMLDAASDYKRNYQKSAFDILLKNKTLANKYITNISYLAKGHLSPVCDFILDSWKAASFFFLNSVPQWQVINNSNWKRLENMVREAAKYYAEDLQVLTGGHETLELIDVKNQKTKIYLDTRQSMLAVPKYMWKIVYSEKSKKAVAFVVLNNPFTVSLERNDILCRDICSQYGWDKPEWKNGKNGFIYCCDARDLLRIVSGPQMDIGGVLDGRNVKKNGPLNSAC